MSEAATWRMSKTHYRLKGSRCTDCGRLYFPPKSFCDNEGRKSEMEPVYFGERGGEIFSGSVTRQPTTKFQYLTSPISIYVKYRYDGGSCMFAGRLTDSLAPVEEVEVQDFIGKDVVPRFRRVFDDGGLIRYSKLAFTMADDYYESPHLKDLPGQLEDQETSEKVGIVGYGAYVPKYRIKVEDVAEAHGKDGSSYRGVVKEKSVPFLDEDTRTFAVEAADRALFHSGVSPEEVDVVSVGSESNPYVVYPVAVTVVDACGISQYVNAYDASFACKAATSQFGLMAGGIFSGQYKNALIVGSDNSQATPGDALDYSVGAGAAALLLGREGVVATLEAVAHYSSDTPDFYRREGDKYPTHGHRFTGEQAYFRHVVNAGEKLLEKIDMEPRDFDYFVAHQPNSKFPRSAAKELGFEPEQFELSNAVDYVGNLYAGSSIAGLCRVLDEAKPEQRIMFVSYGSGAGSDAYYFQVTAAVEEKEERSVTLDSQIFHPKREYVDYEFYRRAKESTG